MFQMNTSGSWSGQPLNVSPVCMKFSAWVAISLFRGGEGGCDAGLGAHGLSGGSDSVLGVSGAVLMCGNGNVLRGKLRRLVKLCLAGVSASHVSGPSKSSRSRDGLLLGCAVVVVSFFVLLAGVFLLALNWLFGPHGGIVHLFSDISLLC
jgi:hypothetical protein